MSTASTAQDRFVEIDLGWFDPDRIEAQVDELLGRLAPLYDGAEGETGLVLNVGWIADVLTEWTGDPSQRLPLRSRRLAHWADRSYDDLRRLVAAVRERAARPGFRVGLLLVGWAYVVWPADTKIYDLGSSWYERHPELYPRPISMIGMPDLDPRVPLHADDYPYASHPGGVPEGLSFADLLAGQWAAVSAFTGLDLLHLRDGFFGPLVYTRHGPAGVRPPADPAESATWTAAVTGLFRALKRATPEALLAGYSSAIGAIAELRVGCVDLEAVVADGAIDLWIDQTWGGAWQDWWDQGWKTWTFQVANMLTHGALVTEGNRRRPPGSAPCRHLCLIETWDSWEPWDTLHRTPEKLRWGIWALTHAAVNTPDGLVLPGGAYVSWANHRTGRILSGDDVAFLARELAVATASAVATDAVFGPVLVLDRPAIEAAVAGHPDQAVGEWIDDHAGMLMKWATPCLSSTRAEWGLGTGPDGCIAGLSLAGTPALVTGRADAVTAEARAAAGVAGVGRVVPDGYVEARAAATDLPAEDTIHLPAHALVEAAPDAEVLYASDDTPLLVRRDGVAWWQPPDWAEPTNPLLPRSQLGSTTPHVLAARTLARSARRAGGSAADPVAAHEPVCWHLWRSGGRIHLLFGNLETGWIGDARHPRKVTVQLGAEALGLPSARRWRLVPHRPGDGDPVDGDGLRFTVEVPPEGCRVLVLEEAS